MIRMSQNLYPKKVHFHQDMPPSGSDQTLNSNSESGYFNQTSRQNLFRYRESVYPIAIKDFH